jgi:1-acyl-sn-glycerol-3-phosphate acyltransferase
VSIERKPSRLEQRLILTPIRAFLKRKFHITVERNDTLQMKPPYLILSNHVNNWDPLFINCFVNEPICFVAAAPLFRNPFLKRVLDYTGAISKTKFNLNFESPE